MKTSTFRNFGSEAKNIFNWLYFKLDDIAKVGAARTMCEQYRYWGVGSIWFNSLYLIFPSRRDSI